MRVRIAGLLVIVRAIGPLILAVVLVLSSWATVNSITDSADAYATSVDARLTGIKATFTDVGEGLEDVGKFVADLSGVVTTAFNSLNSIPFVLDLGPLGTIPIPGAQAARQLFAGAANAASEVSAQLEAQFASLLNTPDEISAIASETVAFAADVRSAVVWWLKVVIGSLLIAALMWLGFRGTAILGEIRRGWAMLRGVAPPALGIEQLRAQLAAIESKLASF